jgi:hypothetical protein
MESDAAPIRCRLIVAVGHLREALSYAKKLEQKLDPDGDMNVLSSPIERAIKSLDHHPVRPKQPPNHW